VAGKRADFNANCQRLNAMFLPRTTQCTTHTCCTTPTTTQRATHSEQPPHQQHHHQRGGEQKFSLQAQFNL